MDKILKVLLIFAVFVGLFLYAFINRYELVPLTTSVMAYKLDRWTGKINLIAREYDAGRVTLLPISQKKINEKLKKLLGLKELKKWEESEKLLEEIKENIRILHESDPVKLDSILIKLDSMDSLIQSKKSIEQ